MSRHNSCISFPLLEYHPWTSSYNISFFISFPPYWIATQYYFWDPASSMKYTNLKSLLILGPSLIKPCPWQDLDTRCISWRFYDAVYLILILQTTGQQHFYNHLFVDFHINWSWNDGHLQRNNKSLTFKISKTLPGRSKFELENDEMYDPSTCIFYPVV